MADDELVAQTIKLENYIQKLKIKHKSTVLFTREGTYRTSIYRTDITCQTLKPEDLSHIASIFQSTLAPTLATSEDFLNLLSTLTKRLVILRLDRPPQTVKEELRKWPDKMQIAAVGSPEPQFRPEIEQFLQFRPQREAKIVETHRTGHFGAVRVFVSGLALFLTAPDFLHFILPAHRDHDFCDHSAGHLLRAAVDRVRILAAAGRV